MKDVPDADILKSHIVVKRNAWELSVDVHKALVDDGVQGPHVLGEDLWREFDKAMTEARRVLGHSGTDSADTPGLKPLIDLKPKEFKWASDKNPSFTPAKCELSYTGSAKSTFDVSMRFQVTLQQGQRINLAEIPLLADGSIPISKRVMTIT